MKDERKKGLWAFALLLLFVALSLFGQNQGAYAGQRQDLIIQPHGKVNVQELPAVALEAPVDREAAPFRLPDPELFRQEKERMNQETLGEGPAPGEGLEIEPQDVNLLTNFIGLRRIESGGFIPPDNGTAAGPNHIFETVNVRGRIFTKAGALVQTVNLNTFFNVPGVSLSDPIMRFDHVSQRWFVGIITIESSGSRWLLAVSTTSDPTGAFVLYSFLTPGSLPDFPNMGISDDKVVLTANAFACNPNCGGPFQGTEFLVFNKADLVAGVAAATNFFAPPQGLFTLRAAQNLSANTTLFMVSHGGNFLRIWSVTGVPGIGPGATFTTVDRPILAMTIPPDAQQLGGLPLIATNDNRLLEAVFRDGSLWTTGAVGCIPSGDNVTRACLRMIEVMTLGLTVSQDFNFGISGIYMYFPAITLDSLNNLIGVFSRSSASEFAGVWASGRLSADPPNTLQNPTLIKAGEAHYSPFANRWGDYSAASVDPVDPTKVWVSGEYARIEDGSEWGTWIAQVNIGAAIVNMVSGDIFVDGVGQAGRNVKLINMATGTKVATNTDANGHYEFSPVANGTYKINISLNLAAPGTVSGHLEVNALPEAGKKVKIKLQGTDITDANGDFSIANVAAGPRKVVITNVDVP